MCMQVGGAAGSCGTALPAPIAQYAPSAPAVVQQQSSQQRADLGMQAVSMLAQQLDVDIQRLGPTDSRVPQLVELRSRVQQLGSQVAATGSAQAVDLLELKLEHAITFASGDPASRGASPQQAQAIAAQRGTYESMRPRIAQIRADAARTGAPNPYDLMDLTLDMTITSAIDGTPLKQGLFALKQRVALERAHSAGGQPDPARLQAIQAEFAALMPGR